MTLREKIKSRATWRTREIKALLNHKRYVFLSRRSKPGSKRRAFLMGRRTHWWREYKEAHANRVARDKQIPKTPQRMSKKGLDMLVRSEGYVPYAYNDPAGHATFGVGHLLHLGNVTQADRNVWGTKARPKGRAMVMSTLARDLDKYEDAVKRAITRPMKQHEFDAFVHIAFNIGTGGFASSSIVRNFNAGRRMATADSFLAWNKPSMLMGRRHRERNLFLHGQYN